MRQDLTSAMVLERMKQRTEIISARAEHRRSEKRNKEAASESIDYFYDTFQGMRDDIERKADGAVSVDKPQIVGYLDSLVQDVQKMQQFLNESSMFLASFQIKKAQEQIDELHVLVKNKIDTLQPKKKFGFGKKSVEKKNKSRELKTDETDTTSKGKIDTLNEIIEKQFFGFKDESAKTLAKTASELENRQLNLQNLKNCKVITLGNPSTLQVASLTNCVVLVGPTSRSVFIKDCINCKFVIACQQVRIHNTVDTEFYLHVTGAAIIEGCRGVQFAPYTITYPELDNHFSQSGLDLNTNNWNKIEDFHWLNETEASPNWSIIREEKREYNWL
ncbi:hypothetical protein SK128_019784 [Halocaridina rubra]|uniref:C-CAP/cofactor C-like domain-containing protein n=1 Tax=Halocaridina rubra TaxID=373956 RepID=A0AAN8WTT1_HALRR